MRMTSTATFWPARTAGSDIMEQKGVCREIGHPVQHGAGSANYLLPTDHRRLDSMTRSFEGATPQGPEFGKRQLHPGVINMWCAALTTRNIMHHNPRRLPAPRPRGPRSICLRGLAQRGSSPTLSGRHQVIPSVHRIAESAWTGSSRPTTPCWVHDLFPHPQRGPVPDVLGKLSKVATRPPGAAEATIAAGLHRANGQLGSDGLRLHLTRPRGRPGAPREGHHEGRRHCAVPV